MEKLNQFDKEINSQKETSKGCCSYVNSEGVMNNILMVTKETFRSLASEKYVDSRAESLITDCLKKLKVEKKSKFYDVCETLIKIKIQDVLLELAEEIKSDKNFVVGYEQNKPVVITNSKYYKNEIKYNLDLVKFQGIEFITID